MNYMINYPAVTCGTVGQSQMSNPVSGAMNLNVQSQRTIVLTPPAASPQTAGHPVNSNNGQTSFPMVMQMSSSNGQLVFYVNEGVVNSGIHNKSNDSSSNSCISQVLLSPVSPVQSGLNVLKNSGNSPNNIGSVNIQHSESKTAAHSLGEVFNLQSVHTMQSARPLVQGNTVGPNVPVNQSTQASGNSSIEIPNLISSLQSTPVVPVLSNCAQVQNDHSNVYKVVDNTGNVTVFTTGVSEPLITQNGDQFVATNNNLIPTVNMERYFLFKLKSCKAIKNNFEIILKVF